MFLQRLIHQYPVANHLFDDSAAVVFSFSSSSDPIQLLVAYIVYSKLRDLIRHQSRLNLATDSLRHHLESRLDLACDTSRLDV